jgi:DNA-binding NtrC family response regulator
LEDSGSSSVEALDQRAIIESLGNKFAGTSPKMLGAGRLALRVSSFDLPVLITGETGTGKEMVARAIHNASPRSDGPFVPVAEGMFPSTLIESVLFGHEKGSFTGANDKQVGKLALANGGTLFLDQVGDLSWDAQVKLLRALQEQEITPIGGKRPIPVDFRLVSATNRDLPALIRDGVFREDFYFRIKGLAIHLPPLRDRGDDVLIIAEKIAEEFARKNKQSIPQISLQAKQFLRNQTWRGNVRQLEVTIKLAVVLCEKNSIDVPLLQQCLQDPLGNVDSANGISNDLFDQPWAIVEERVKREFLLRLVSSCNGRMDEMKKKADWSREHTLKTLKQFNIKYRPDSS